MSGYGHRTQVAETTSAQPKEPAEAARIAAQLHKLELFGIEDLGNLPVSPEVLDELFTRTFPTVEGSAIGDVGHLEADLLEPEQHFSLQAVVTALKIRHDDVVAEQMPFVEQHPRVA